MAINRISERLITTEEWKAEHLPHLAEEGGHGPYQFAKDVVRHPEGNWTRLGCPCGSTHLTNKPV